MTRIIAIAIIMCGMGVTPYQMPTPVCFDWSYEREIAIQAHSYHGIKDSIWPVLGEAYFLRSGERCNLITTICTWKVIL